jgi:hypothetical protein
MPPGQPLCCRAGKRITHAMWSPGKGQIAAEGGAGRRPTQRCDVQEPPSAQARMIVRSHMGGARRRSLPLIATQAHRRHHRQGRHRPTPQDPLRGRLRRQTHDLPARLAAQPHLRCLHSAGHRRAVMTIYGTTTPTRRSTAPRSSSGSTLPIALRRRNGSSVRRGVCQGWRRSSSSLGRKGKDHRHEIPRRARERPAAARRPVVAGVDMPGSG